MAAPQNTIPRRPVPAPANPLDNRRCRQLTSQFRQILSTKRINELSRQSAQRGAQVHPHIDRDYGTEYYTASSSSTSTSTYPSLRNLPLMPEAPDDNKSQRFRNMLMVLSQFPVKWENPGLLDEALKVVPLQHIYAEAEEESQILQAEAESLGRDHMAVWGYEDCVIRALLRWFKRSFFSWVDRPACSACGQSTDGVGMALPTQDESARGASQVELYQCSNEGCRAYERFPRYTDAFVLLQTKRGRAGEWAQCFGMLCRAMGSRVRWVWNSEDHVWIEVYSLHRKRWIHVDVCEQAWDRPKLYTEGWQRKLGYCIAFSADGVSDVTRRYVRNFTKYAEKRERTSESNLLYILNEIRNTRRKDLSKQDKFRLEGEDMRESRELRHYTAQAIAAEACSIKCDEESRAQASIPSRPRLSQQRVDADTAKAREAQMEQEQRTRTRTPNGTGPGQNPQQPQR